MKFTTLILSLWVTASSCQSSPYKEPSNTETMKDNDLVALVQKNDLRAVEAALKQGAAVNTTDNNERSLLLIATINEHTEMAKLLLAFQADVNQQATNQDSPFLYAGASGQTEMLQLFLEKGARFDIFNRYNGSALIPAAERGHVETVRLLANTKNYPIDHVNRLGWTALMEAVILGDGGKKYQKIVQILKDAGATLNIPDKEGRTPLQHAEARKYREIADILKS